LILGYENSQNAFVFDAHIEASLEASLN
jgi:hypothetical protein